ncbi:MAG: zinc ribbon domain-containing protein [Ruminiclostridium sp.]|nr:zinc ribbon domain-containing protein [Ruminiclostridium sp.]
MYCSGCGAKLDDNYTFCNKCGVRVQPQNTSNAVRSAALKLPNTHIVIIISVILALLIVAFVTFAVVLFSGGLGTITGKYEYLNEDNGCYYTIDFKSNGTCIFTDDTHGYTHSRSGSYEYTDGEYILNFAFDDLYLPTTYSASLKGDILSVRQIAGTGPLKYGGNFHR